MHESSLLRMEWFVKNYLQRYRSPVRVLDVGSYDVNGSYKSLFDEKKFVYKGLDISSGPNVDIVPKNIYNWEEIESSSFDVVISGQALEHIEFFWATVAEMVRVLRENRLMCIIAPRGFGRHRHPVDCYRFEADGMIALARYCNVIPVHASTNLAPLNAPPSWYLRDRADSMLIAKKPKDWRGLIDLKTYAYHEVNMEDLATGFVPEEKQRRFFRN